MKLYHGSKNIIEKPIFGGGKLSNDYGQGFYMTENIELAKEWACENENENGYVNFYDLDISNLKILKINEEYDILHWIGILVKYREFNIKSPNFKKAKKILIDNYYIDVDKYDVIIGYRADDCYYSFAKAFLRNEIPLEVLDEIMHIGNLGKQIVLKSKKSFSKIKFIKSEEVDAKEYYFKRALRAKNASEEYYNKLDKITSMKNCLYNIIGIGE